MYFVMGPGSVPAGNYRAVFLGIEAFTQNTAQYGEAVILRWRILGGEHDGQETSRICPARMTPKSALGRFAVALKGSAIAFGEQFSFDVYDGVTGSVIVEPTDSGGTRVSVFLRDGQPISSGPSQIL